MLFFNHYWLKQVAYSANNHKIDIKKASAYQKRQPFSYFI